MYLSLLCIRRICNMSNGRTAEEGDRPAHWGHYIHAPGYTGRVNLHPIRHDDPHRGEEKKQCLAGTYIHTRYTADVRM